MNFNHNVPSSVSEFDQLSKKEGSCLTEAIANIVYRGSLAEFRDTFLHGDEAQGIKGVEQVTKIERLTKTVELKTKNADGTAKSTEAYDESEAVYWHRVKATLIKNGQYANEAEVEAAFQPLADQVAATIVFDPSEQPKKVAGPKRLPKELVEIAEKYINAGKGDAIAKKLATKVGHAVEATVQSIAAAIKEDLDNEAKLRQQKYLDAA
jgi:hypothetical protein